MLGDSIAMSHFAYRACVLKWLLPPSSRLCMELELITKLYAPFICSLLSFTSKITTLQISVMGDKKFDNPQSANLTKVLEDCQVLKICLDQIKQARSNNDGEGTSDVASRSSSSTATTTSVIIH